MSVPLATVLTGPILAHSLGVYRRGEVAAAAAPVLLLASVATFGLPDALTFYVARFPALQPRAISRTLTALFLAGLLGAVACVIFAPVLSPDNSTVIRLIAIAGSAAPLTLLVAGCRGVAAGSQLWRAVNAEQYISAFGRLVVLACLLFTGELGVTSAALTLAYCPTLGLFAYRPVWRYLRHNSEKDHYLSRRAITRYGLKTWTGTFSGTVLSRFDQVLMTPLSGSSQLGLYAVSVNLADLLLVANNAIRDVTFAADAREALNSRVIRSGRLAFTVALVVGGFLVAGSPELIRILFGHAFRAARHSADILVLAAVIGAPTAIAGAALGARGRPGRRSVSLLAAASVNVVGLVLLVPSAGATGAALSTLFGNLTAAVFANYFLWRETAIPMGKLYVPDLRSLVAAVIGARQHARSAFVVRR